MHSMPRVFGRIENWLAGWPDALLSVALVVAAVLLLLLALRGSAMQKAVALAYVVLP